MGVYAGLDVSLKGTEICVVDDSGGMLWRGVADTHPGMSTAALSYGLVRVDLEQLEEL